MNIAVGGPMKVAILGPNMPAEAGETFHVHAAGCADVKRNWWYRGQDPWTIEVSSVIRTVGAIYDPSNFDYDLHDQDDRSPYEGDIRFFPCVDALPYDKEDTDGEAE